MTNLGRLLLVFYKLPFKSKLLAFEVLTGLAIGRLCVIIFEFKSIMKWLGDVCEKIEESSIEINAVANEDLLKIEKMIDKVSNYTIWSSNCYARVLCAAWMLKKRGFSYAAFFGLNKNKEDSILAHAWLQSGHQYITGAPQHEQYKAVGKFVNFKK